MVMLCVIAFLAIGIPRPIDVSINTIGLTFDGDAEHGTAALAVGMRCNDAISAATDRIVIGLKARHRGTWREVRIESVAANPGAEVPPVPDVGVAHTCEVAADHSSEICGARADAVGRFRWHVNLRLNADDVRDADDVVAVGLRLHYPARIER
jgi:hypothetical protein